MVFGAGDDDDCVLFKKFIDRLVIKSILTLNVEETYHWNNAIGGKDA